MNDLIEAEADVMLDSMDIQLNSPAYLEYFPMLVDRLQRFVKALNDDQSYADYQENEQRRNAALRGGL
jgi:hypothetical protein